jgi:hypothetical protein
MVSIKSWQLFVVVAIVYLIGTFYGKMALGDIDPGKMPACGTEAGPASDGTLPCYWNARTHGNGIGDSFVRFDIDRTFIIRTGKVESGW